MKFLVKNSKVQKNKIKEITIIFEIVEFKIFLILNKVFTGLQNGMKVNKKSVIPILIVITIAVITIILTLNEDADSTKINQDVIPHWDGNDKSSTPQVSEYDLKTGNITQVEKLLNKIRNDKIENDNSESPYIPPPREWISSGPVKIDYSEYLLGQKIFVNIAGVGMNESGEVQFFRPVNNTHYKMYYSMPFDGSGVRNNFYLTPDLGELKGICNKDELVGEWKIMLMGTNYPGLKFEVLDSILPGNENRYDTITKGSCQN